MKDERILRAVAIGLLILAACAWIGAWDANRRYRAWQTEWQDYDRIVGAVITGTLGANLMVEDGIRVDSPHFDVYYPTSFAITTTYTMAEFEAIFGPRSGEGPECHE